MCPGALDDLKDLASKLASRVFALLPNIDDGGMQLWDAALLQAVKKAVGVLDDEELSVQVGDASLRIQSKAAESKLESDVVLLERALVDKRVDLSDLQRFVATVRHMEDSPGSEEMRERMHALYIPISAALLRSDDLIQTAERQTCFKVAAVFCRYVGRGPDQGGWTVIFDSLGKVFHTQHE